MEGLHTRLHHAYGVPYRVHIKYSVISAHDVLSAHPLLLSNVMWEDVYAIVSTYRLSGLLYAAKMVAKMYTG